MSNVEFTVIALKDGEVSGMKEMMKVGEVTSGYGNETMDASAGAFT